MSALATSATGSTSSKDNERRPIVFSGGFVGLPTVCPTVPKKKSQKAHGTEKERAQLLEKIKVWVIETIKGSNILSDENVMVLEVRTSGSPLKDSSGSSSMMHAVNCPCCDPYSDYVAGMYGNF